MTITYEIELVNPASDYYHSRVVEGPDAPAGEVPASVRRYADMLASIAGHDTEVKIGMTRLVALDDNGVTNDAWTVWLKEYTWGRTQTEYTVSVSCNFDADSPEDAVRQMTAWLDEAAYHAGYRVIGTDGSSSFLDADRL